MDTVVEQARHAQANRLPGAIDCDVHPRAPCLRELTPYFDALGIGIMWLFPQIVLILPQLM